MEKTFGMKVKVLLNGETCFTQLRDLTAFSEEEKAAFTQMFGKDWNNSFPIVFNQALPELVLDLSKTSLGSEDIPYFSIIYNNPKSINEIVKKEVTNLEQIRKYQQVISKINLQIVDSSINERKNQIYEQKKILILCDLNGTLIHKSEKELLCNDNRPPDQKLKKDAFIYIRPGYSTFLKKILEHPRCVFSIYSSMMQHNIIKVKSVLFRDPILKKLEHKCLQTMFDREYNVKDPEGEHSYDTMRDLNKVWGAPELKSKFGPENTVLIDSDQKKTRNCKGNLFICFPYIDDFVIHNKPNNTYYMNALGDYMVNLLDRADDTTDYLMKTPFEIDSLIFQEEDKEFAKIVQEQKMKAAAIKKEPFPAKEEEKKSGSVPGSTGTAKTTNDITQKLEVIVDEMDKSEI